MPCVCANGRFLLAEGFAGTLISEALKRKQASLPQSPLPGGQTLIAAAPEAPSHTFSPTPSSDAIPSRLNSCLLITHYILLVHRLFP